MSPYAIRCTRYYIRLINTTRSSSSRGGDSDGGGVRSVAAVDCTPGLSNDSLPHVKQNSRNPTELRVLRRRISESTTEVLLNARTPIRLHAQ